MVKIPIFSIATVLCWVALFWGTLTPGNDLPEFVFNVYDKLLHFGVFMVFSSVFLIAGHRERFLWLTQSNLLKVVLILSGLTAAATEVLQHFIPGRLMSLADLVANMLGVLGGYVVYRLWCMIFDRKH